MFLKSLNPRCHLKAYQATISTKTPRDAVEPQYTSGVPRRKYLTVLSSQLHIRRPTWRRGHCQNLEARSSCLSGSGTSALLDVIMATFRWTKSRKNGDLYAPASPGGTVMMFGQYTCSEI